jgi:hypothetical protein
MSRQLQRRVLLRCPVQLLCSPPAGVAIVEVAMAGPIAARSASTAGTARPTTLAGLDGERLVGVAM